MSIVEDSATWPKLALWFYYLQFEPFLNPVLKYLEIPIYSA